MTALRESLRPGRRLWCRLFGALVVALALVASQARASEPLVVVLDQAQVVKVPERVATLVVGNPLIADVSVQSGGLAVVTGKGHGVTNLVALDRSGTVLLERQIQVQPARDNVVVLYRGIERETYSCTPNCSRRITLGDNNTFFVQSLTQTSVLNGQAVAIGQSGSR
jgi:Flp pilus assembly secretin CpaC